MRQVLHRVQFEYSQGGFRHVVVGGLEKALVEALRRFPFVYWRVAPRYFRWRCSNDVLACQCPPDPFKVEYVDPDVIERRTGRSGREHLNRRKLFGSVLDEDWDETGKPVKESSVYQAAEEHFVDGVPWEETDAVQHRITKLERGEYSPWKYETKEDLLDRYQQFDELYKQIHTEGYRSQREILKHTSDTNEGLFLDTLDEVTVDVGRNGELLHVDGIHRLAIAKILGIEKIPVVFLVRHEKWMEYREELCESDKPIPDHPDLRDLK